MNSFLTSDKTKIYYNMQGSGKPIIFIHGFAARSSVFRIPQKILSKGYLTLSYDQRGHGRSREIVEGMSMDILARDLYELIGYHKLVGVTLVGWSMGGSVIFEYLRKYNCKNLDRIVIVDTGPKVVNTKDWGLGLYKGRYDEESAKSHLEKMRNNWYDFSKDFMSKMAIHLQEKQLDAAIKSMGDNDPTYMKGIWEDLTSKDYRDILKDINIPSLIIMGGRSSLYSIDTGQYLNDKIKDSKLIIFEENGHLLVQESPTSFSRVLKDFVL